MSGISKTGQCVPTIASFSTFLFVTKIFWPLKIYFEHRQAPWPYNSMSSRRQGHHHLSQDWLGRSYLKKKTLFPVLRYSPAISEFTEKGSALVVKMLEKWFCDFEVLQFEYGSPWPSFALYYWSRDASRTWHKGVVYETRKSLPPHSKLTS